MPLLTTTYSDYHSPPSYFNDNSLPTSPVANGLAVAQQMATAVAGIEFRKKQPSIKHRASFHGRGIVFILYVFDCKNSI